jgi:HEAT repeat protein
VKAVSDKNFTVRAAALEAISLRGDPSLLPKVSAALDDDKDLVRFAAAACVAHLSGLAEKPAGSKASRP